MTHIHDDNIPVMVDSKTFFDDKDVVSCSIYPGGDIFCLTVEDKKTKKKKIVYCRKTFIPEETLEKCKKLYRKPLV